jgi:hypothetical protein
MGLVPRLAARESAVGTAGRRDIRMPDSGALSIASDVPSRWCSDLCQAWEHHTAVVDNLDDVKGYATSDLCVNHPTKKHLWKLCVRRPILYGGES